MSVLTRFAVLLSLFISPAQASSGPIPLTLSTIGMFCVGLFVLAYALVMAEEYLQLRKSKPVLVAAGVIWILIGIAYAQNGMSPAAEQAFRHTLLEYAELMLFLLVAMTYINAMEDRNLFDALRAWLIRSGFQLRTLFWLTGDWHFASRR